MHIGEEGRLGPESTNEASVILTELIKGLVDHPDRVDIQSLDGSQSTVFEVKVAPIDVRRIIGRRGRTADAIREILLNLGSKAGRRYLLQIVEPQERAG